MEFKGKMYLKYKKEEDIWEIYDLHNPNDLLFTKNPRKEPFVNKIITENIENYPFNRNMRIDLSLEKQSKDYNPKFWVHYNAPQKTKALSKIEAYLKEQQ